MCRKYGSGDRAYYRACYATQQPGAHIPAAIAVLGKTGRHVVFGRMVGSGRSAPKARPYDLTNRSCILCHDALEVRQEQREVDVCIACERGNSGNADRAEEGGAE